MNFEFGIRNSEIGIFAPPNWVERVDGQEIRNSKFEIRNVGTGAWI